LLEVACIGMLVSLYNSSILLPNCCHESNQYQIARQGKRALQKYC
jgi:hypothetical protein